MTPVNNAFYDDLGDRWFEGGDHAIALLRAETDLKLEYALEAFHEFGIESGARVLDVACGGGLVSLPLAEKGFRVEGVDLSESSLEVARSRADGLDATFRVADATNLDHGDGSVDAVLLFDVIEHVEDQRKLLAEATRVVRKGGIVLFNTFNQTPLSWLLAVHGFKFVTRETPDHVHVWRLFVPPTTLGEWAALEGLEIVDIQGVRPRLGAPFWRSILRRRVDPEFAFTKTRSWAIGYMGLGIRRH
ncbi:bifunctional 2-polyprenyl-6-hydroxyphenol methylase/3-demethylubiquinol 3-O-methyltransferase UbiG [Rubrivirga sp.]|uniref:bifunctional 2-polyprenyl-6-hydroxyphenol methylase/3-demethylubiquinol 3-O-methyltransferase UbiG n=1 Tax=Rubrivirga sp. TaxID=1885344 RepID=UPI003C71CD0A